MKLLHFPHRYPMHFPSLQHPQHYIINLQFSLRQVIPDTTSRTLPLHCRQLQIIIWHYSILGKATSFAIPTRGHRCTQIPANFHLDFTAAQPAAATPEERGGTRTHSHIRTAPAPPRTRRHSRADRSRRPSRRSPARRRRVPRRMHTIYMIVFIFKTECFKRCYSSF